MFSWAIDEGKLKRKENPVSKITKNLPTKNQGEVVLSLAESRIVWEAAGSTGYLFGTHVQLMLLTGCRLDEWASARTGWIDTHAALIVIPRQGYKSDHVHVVPLVPQAVAILNAIPERRAGDYLFSSDGGRTPVSGISKYYRTRLRNSIIANTGSPLTKEFTSHDLRRTVATRLAEALGEEGDKLIKRVLSHSDGSVTAIYNRYGYVREVRQALERWRTILRRMGLQGRELLRRYPAAKSRVAKTRTGRCRRYGRRRACTHFMGANRKARSPLECQRRTAITARACRGATKDV
ncbi:MAG: tyrosine-type recombinase/integrase [Chloroflexota bacterium]